MKLDAHTHLTYCSNIHPAERWDDVAANLAMHVPQIRTHMEQTGQFGLGLRLSAIAARHLVSHPGALAAFRAWMQTSRTYVFTLNGFPYGQFHGTRVKEAVYRPDWSSPERLEYTKDLIELLAELVPEGVTGSISTVPGGFRFDPVSETPERIRDHLVEAAAQCWAVERTHGKDLCIALEPEPRCVLETTTEAIAFFENWLLAPSTASMFAARTGCALKQAESALRRHLALCFDTCHAAVEFEDPREGPKALRSAGIRVGKCQITAGLSLQNPSPESIERLERFSEDTYLHQVVIDGPDGLRRLLDLPEAIALHRAGRAPQGPWRIHVHVPVFADLEAPLASTATFAAAAMTALAGQTDHFEVETYTWDVLPPELRNLPLSEAIARELQWAHDCWQRNSVSVHP